MIKFIVGDFSMSHHLISRSFFIVPSSNLYLITLAGTPAQTAWGSTPLVDIAPAPSEVKSFLAYHKSFGV